MLKSALYVGVMLLMLCASGAAQANPGGDPSARAEEASEASKPQDEEQRREAPEIRFRLELKRAVRDFELV